MIRAASSMHGEVMALKSASLPLSPSLPVALPFELDAASKRRKCRRPDEELDGIGHDMPFH